MRFGKSLLLALTALICLAATPAAAAPAPVTLDSDGLKALFTDLVTRDTPWPKEKLVVDNFTASPTSLEVPAGTVEYRLVNQTHTKFLGGKTLTVAVLVNGTECGTVRMAGDLQLYDQVLCTTRRLSRHEVLTPDDIKTVRQNITMLGSDLLSSPEEAVGKRLTTSLRAGTVLRSSHLDEPPLIHRGDLVTIVARGQQLRATVPGEARGSGARGELIRVKNLMSRKELYAKVVSSGTVEVQYH